jgi:hypothetical protein
MVGLLVAVLLTVVVHYAASVPDSTVPVDASGTASVTRTYHILLTGKARIMVKGAIEGAVRRLAKPQCQQLFTDFTDPVGNVLADRLVAWGTSPEEALSALYFVEGDDAPQCHNDGTRAAFTKPGNRVVYVCGTRFIERFGRRTAGEILLIHELLHALGLGEDPPTSAQISDSVRARCAN